MDFALNAHQQEVQRSAREYAVSTIAPVAAELDRKGRCPAEILAGVADLGLLGCEDDFVAYVAGLVEISKAWASLGAVVAVHNSLVCHPISRYGSDAQKNKYLTLLTEQKQLGCYAFAEPLAGSDAGAIRTTAVLDGDAYVLNGHKRFVTSGRQARVAIVYALTDPSKGRDGLSAFIVDTDTPGFAVGDGNDMLGLRATETVDLLLRRLPRAEGEPAGRIESGIRDRPLDRRRRPHRHRRAGGRNRRSLPRAEHRKGERPQTIRPPDRRVRGHSMDGGGHVDRDRCGAPADVSRGRHAREKPEDGRLTLAASMAKLFASEAANRAAYDAMQIFGGHGYLTEYPVERLFRDARAMTLYEETSEIQRLVIERELAK